MIASRFLQDSKTAQQLTHTSAISFKKKINLQQSGTHTKILQGGGSQNLN